MVREENDWILSVWAQSQLVEFRDRLMPKPQSAVGSFPTPNGSRWTDVQIQFRDGETISVKIDKQREVLSFAQLGLCDSRSGKPSKQWELLRTFADNHGVMTWQSPGACRQNRKRRELLNESLRKFFGIDGDPIELTDDKQGWRCLIRLKSDRL
jgi:hypothetical protein